MPKHFLTVDYFKIPNHDESSSDFFWSAGHCIYTITPSSIHWFHPIPFYLCKWILFYLQVSKVQPHLVDKVAVSVRSRISKKYAHVFKRATTVMPVSIYT